MIRDIKLRYTDAVIEHDDTASLTEMRLYPLFFKTKFGRRETYSSYKGFLIVRHTLPESRQRITILYIFFKNLEGHADFLCIDHPKNVKYAKKLADDILQNCRIPRKDDAL